MDAGIASTILFVYPVMVAVIMGGVLQGKKYPQLQFSLFCWHFLGIALLYQGEW